MSAQPRGFLAALRRTQLYRSIFRHESLGDDRDRVLRISSTLFLHVHPTKIPKHALRFRFTWGMGGIATLLLIVLAITGVALMFGYRPTVAHAPADVRALAADHRILRNAHRFASHAVLIAAWLHLVRVFLTGSYKPPREFNWVLGLALLALTTGLAVTGHLLPGDASGDGTTLLRAYVLHCALLPAAAALIVAVHFWRVRKDGGISGPPIVGPQTISPRPDLVHTWPHLVRLEARATLIVLALLALWATLANAPLGPPAPVPWHLAPLALLASCFHPTMAISLLAIAILALAALPYVDTNPAGNGFYAFHPRRFAVTTFLAAFLGLWIAPIALAPFVHLDGPTRDVPAAIGLACAPLWLIVLPAVYRRRSRLDPTRFWIAAIAFQALTAVAIKILLRLLFGVRYLAPGFGF